MFDPFSASLGVFFGGPGSVEARYQPQGAPALVDPIRVIRSQPDRFARYGAVQVAAGTDAIEIRRADVPAPAHGDIIIIGTETFVVTGEPLGDVEGLTWTCWTEIVR